METLAPLLLPLQGRRLIEASAGTGKTYTIVTLYLRLLLGLGGEAAYPRRLMVEEILVVTFTEAATQELRNRILQNIHQLRLSCQQHPENNRHPLYDEIADKAAAVRLLLIAESAMDNAAIYTIHSFCQKILANNAFEAGLPFRRQFIRDEHFIRQQAVYDFWRRYFYDLPRSLTQIIMQFWSSPDQLLIDISPYLTGEMPIFSYQPDTNDIRQLLLTHHQQNMQRINVLKSIWQNEGGEVEAIINQSDVDKRSYSKRFLSGWLTQISQWAQSETQDYSLPDCLIRFSQRTLSEKSKSGQAPLLPLFIHIEQFFQEPLQLHGIILTLALKKVRHYIAQYKQQNSLFGFDDLLTELDAVLQNEQIGKRLAAKIARLYPVAMVDEFQDTDPLQYRIFDAIYTQPQTALMLIGDPKQAIYSFRGADIFAYITAKQRVDAIYTMVTNWRSSAPMIEAVNRLFQSIDSPFIFKHIPFIEVNPAEKNRYLQFLIDNKPVNAVEISILAEEKVNLSIYQQHMAEHFAEKIQSWLVAGWQNLAQLVDAENHQRAVTAADIAILVRTGKEAALIKKALLTRNIQSVYLSNRDTVFETREAQELVWLLQAVLSPQKSSRLKTVFASNLFALSFAHIEALIQQDSNWDTAVEQFIIYQQIWLKQGILPMLKAVMRDYHIAENLLAEESGERRLTDLLHLGELLQEAAYTLDSEHGLIRWLIEQIAEHNHDAENTQQRLESDNHLVQIITIHKSKGLEYPIVCLPFIGGYRSAKHPIYHERETFCTVVDNFATKQSLFLADEERLSEDLRLLYVALTRAIYHCSIGLAALSIGNKKADESDVHRSAIDYILQQKQAGNYYELMQAIHDYNCYAVNVIKTPLPVTKLPAQSAKKPQLAARQFTRNLTDNWQVSSYSYLQQQATMFDEFLPYFERENVSARAREPLPTALSIHTLPRGASIGNELHQLLEQLDFTQSISPQLFDSLIRMFDLDENWYSVLQDWLQNMLATPLPESGITLRQITRQCRLNEMQFCLPIRQLFSSVPFNRLIKKYDPLSQNCADIDFHQFKGALKGFIDLIIYWQDRYYIVDYKSNWLGENDRAYQRASLEVAMCEHRYDLQYQFYTLALHRYLKQRIINYDYQKDFGGVYYLFLRGMNGKSVENGVFYCRPPLALIAQLDRLLG